MYLKTRVARRVEIAPLALRFFFGALLNMTLLIAASQPVEAQTPRGRATMRLCDGYEPGSVSIELGYRFPGQVEFSPIAITSESINSGNRTATVEFILPHVVGAPVFSIAAFCRNEIGLSAPSNEAAISNCSVIAHFDSDGDGLSNAVEDSTCDNFYSPGDSSNAFNVDTDGDGVRDLVELLNKTDPSNPGSSPRPYVISGGPFDPDGNVDSNSVVWRAWNGSWYIKDFGVPGNNLSFQFGLPGDIPIVYQPAQTTSNVGVVRRINNGYLWVLRGPGFVRTNAPAQDVFWFGIFGDNIILGPWETPGVTNPAVARLFNNSWSFDILLRDGTVRHVNWGGNGDVPKVQDYDGDGVFDIAVYRPGEQKTYVLRSRWNDIGVYNFGTGTADMTVRGDYTGDGVGDLTFWEPLTGMFTTLTSNNGFIDTARDSSHYFEEQLGLYNVHVPLSWNHRGGKDIYTVVDHPAGLRYWREDNNPGAPVSVEQWGLPGDAQG